MVIKENKYHSTVKLEFKQVVQSMVEEDRTSYHIYTIHRLLSLGLLVDFTHEYLKNTTDDEYVYIRLDLKEFGNVCFKIDTSINRGGVADERSMQVLRNFVGLYNISLEDTGQKGIR
jgi:hypothetical protein